MNKTILMGRLAVEPELRHTKSNVPVCTFTLAVDRPKQKDKEQEADWPTIVAWRSKAEFAAKYLKKGRRVLVTATVRTRTYEDDNGKKHKVTEFYADEIEFCDSKPQEASGGAQENTPYQAPDGFEEIDPSDDDLPF
jgi:single-strand DNA-binding protein